MSYWEKITILIHTKDRPWFLLRLIKYYNEKLSSVGINVMILDGSSDENFAIISEELSRKKYKLRPRVLHHSPSASLVHRVVEALELISTPYVLLAANDDIYFFDWLKSAVELLDSDDTYGVVYGHAISFELEQFTPYGKLFKADVIKPNPPARWLEGDTPLDRLTELGKSNWTTIGWYALQRTELLSVIARSAEDYEFNVRHFELFFVFCQTALSKTKMLDEIYLARQKCVDAKYRTLSFKEDEEAFKKIMNVSVSILSQHKNIEMKSAISMVENAFRAELDQLKQNDSRKYFRIIADYFPVLRELKSHFNSFMMKKGFKFDPLLSDERFPATPNISFEHPKIKELVDIVANVDSV